MGWELEDVERRFIEHLASLGWTHVAGSLDDPAATQRAGFSQVIQESVLRQKLRELNLRDGKSWLDEGRLSEAVSAITRISAPKLIEANQIATELLLKGITVDGLPDWNGGRGQTLRYIDWEKPENNQFTVISQFRVDCPPGYDRGKGFIVPDLVLFVNGMPLVVVECKSPSVPEPLVQAVDQLRRYSNQRRATFEVEDNEGNEPLFHTNQLLIATSFDQARVGCIGGLFEDYATWKTVAPLTESDVATQLGKKPSEQEFTIAGMLSKANLLDIVRHFMLFMHTRGQTMKAVCRYQQFRAVSKAVQRLRTGQTRWQDGEHDRRGGIIWHTQGSGKSLTMVFLVRKMRTDPQLRRFKIIVVTDRKDLQRQLAETAALSGETVEIATSKAALRTLVTRKGPGLVFGMVQKYGESDAADEEPLKLEDLPKYPHVSDAPRTDVLNDDSSILVLVDEAHRSHTNDLHAYLMSSMPNCAKIGFTGTPIIMGEKKRTHEIFGEFIDRYTIRESEQDGSTVPVLYEGRTAQGAVKDGASLDELFEDLFRTRSEEELEAIKKKYATRGQIFEAPELIKEKARDILRHYVTNILPNGYKAQVVAYSRLAAVRYLDALNAARAQLLNDAESLSPADQTLDDEALCQRPPKVQAVVQAWRYREALKALECAPIISGGNNDDPAWKQWTDGAVQEGLIKRFRKPLLHDDPQKRDPLAFLIVKSMLLTGFDAPIEGVMYLDRPIKEAELLQAIARVNRTGFGKRAGIVVDYYGLAHHLKEALAAYADEDVAGALQSLKDEIPALRDRHLRAIHIFRRNGIDSLEDREACVDVLRDERLRAEFTVKLRHFLESLDTVLPRPEGLPFTRDAKTLAYIHARARTRYKDMPQIGKDVGAKVRKLIDDHVISLGIDPKIPPISLTDANFAAHVQEQAGPRAKASEMEHAIRSHIRKHLDEDPVLYRKLSERLKDILEQLGDNWEEQIAALQDIIRNLKAGQSEGDEGLPDLPEHCLPFFRLMMEETQTGNDADAEQVGAVMNLTMEVVDIIAAELTENFWRPNKKPDQDALATRLFEHLMASRRVELDDADALVDKLMDLARANHHKLMTA
ncbi:MAG TPA: type I restriction endonuclease subunit R [Povalibacter sp.]|uniref:type I restriction endonuclease subunit R n=1 Tax=Povalibacter sp. TaxID=1962978 RepID=UPI002C609095|nr:type I restriction endonuclease subunit R [Povalibacter sp.]HMN44237.1 type I restriction endonuclease subunit R [Povalibacter sp.]